MKLFYTPTSPYARKVLVVAIETGLDEQIERVNADPWTADSEVGQYNPLGKVPALLTAEQDILFDSPVICEYLDSLHGGAKFFPAQGKARWQALRTQALADGILDATVLTRLESMRAEDKRNEAWTERQRVAIRRGLDILEREAQMLNGSVTISHVAVACALGYLDFRLSEEHWRVPHPRLASWFAVWSTRSSMQHTEPPS